MDRTLIHCPDTGTTFHHRFTDLYYADDVALFAELLDTFVDVLETLSLEASPLGLKINWVKTKIQSLSDFSPSPVQSLRIVAAFTYLGARITSDCSSDLEILRRIQLARSVSGRLMKIWTNHNLSLSTKIRVLNTPVIPVLLYGCET